MIRGLPRFAVLVAAAAASAALIGGTAQAGEPVNKGGKPGEATATNICRTSMPPEGDADEEFCTVKVTPGAPGPAVAYN